MVDESENLRIGGGIVVPSLCSLGPRVTWASNLVLLYISRNISSNLLS